MADIARDTIFSLQSVPVTTLARQPAAVCALVQCLDDARPEVARAAAATLEKMVRLHRLRPQHMPAGLPAAARGRLLDRLARSPAAAVRRLAADALREAEQVEAAAGFLGGLADPDAAVRAACLQALERVRLGTAHMDQVTALLTRERTKVRCAVLDALAMHMDRDLLLALAPRLVALLAHAEGAVRVRAGHLLEPLRAPPPALWPVLVETLQRGTPWQRAAALRRLADAGARALPHLPAMLAAATDDDAAVRSYAVTALAAVAPGDEQVRQALLAALADPASAPRRAAVTGLAAPAADTAADTAAHAGTLDAAMLAALAALAGDPGAPGAARAAAVEVLGTSGPSTMSLDALATALDAPALEVAEAAAEALGRMGPTARPAAGALERQLGRADMRLSAASALVAIGAVGPGLRAALHAAAREGEDWSRELAEALLAELG